MWTRPQGVNGTYTCEWAFHVWMGHPRVNGLKCHICWNFKSSLPQEITTANEPSYDKRDRSAVRVEIRQTRMHSCSIEPEMWRCVWSFLLFHKHVLCERTAKALARQRGCAGSPEPSLVTYVMSTFFSWVGSIYFDRGMCKPHKNECVWYIQTHPSWNVFARSDILSCARQHNARPRAKLGSQDSVYSVQYIS